MSNKQLLLLLKTSVRCPRAHEWDWKLCVQMKDNFWGKKKKSALKHIFQPPESRELKQSNVKNSK